MKGSFKLLVYVSLLFFGIHLYRQGVFATPRVRSYAALGLSFPFLAAGFFAAAIVWHRVLMATGFPCRLSESVASAGLSILGKYIPGKLWAVVGRAAYLAGARGYSLGGLTGASLIDTLAVVWVGMTLGGVGLLVMPALRPHALPTALLIVGLPVFLFSLFSSRVHRALESVIGALRRRPIRLPRVSPRAFCRLLPWVVAPWAFWSVGFYFLASGLSSPPPVETILAFPLATSLGAATVIAPGGIGVREGVLAGCLVVSGVPAAEAATVSVASRAWYLIGEIVFFVGGLLARRSLERTASSSRRVPSA